MPCRTDDSYDARHYPSGVSEAKYNDLKKEADNVTKLLCSVMRTLNNDKNAGLLIHGLDSISGLHSWWENHKEIDRKRIEKEVLDAEKSLEGLSSEAKELLIKQLQKNQ